MCHGNHSSRRHVWNVPRNATSLFLTPARGELGKAGGGGGGECATIKFPPYI